MNEDELRSELQRAAGDFTYSTKHLDRARLAASGRRRRRDAARVAATSGAMALIVVFGAAALLSGPNSKAPSTQANFASQTEAAGPEPVDAVVASQRPKLLIGASAAGRLVKIDPISGQTTEVIASVTTERDNTQGLLLGGVAISPDMRNVYFDVDLENGCGGEIRYATLETGKVQRLLNGHAPALSNDGTKLAYVKEVECGKPVVVIRELATAKERVAVSGGNSPSSIKSLSWSPDDSHVMVDARYSDPTADRLAAYATGQASPFGGGEELRPAAGDGTKWEWGAYLPDGRVFVIERCCAREGFITNDASRMVIVDPSDGAEQLIANGFVAKSHTGASSGPTGNHLLYVSGQDLMVSDNGARPTPIGFGLLGAAWR